MKLIVNDKTHELPDSDSVRDLVVALGLGDAPVAVEVNRQLIPHRRHASETLHHGDRVEIVTLVGGG